MSQAQLFSVVSGRFQYAFCRFWYAFGCFRYAFHALYNNNLHALV
nr:MAG TPA: hypothetical protein [Caudoviricetes sp.]